MDVQNVLAVGVRIVRNNCADVGLEPSVLQGLDNMSDRDLERYGDRHPDYFLSAQVRLDERRSAKPPLGGRTAVTRTNLIKRSD